MPLGKNSPLILGGISVVTGLATIGIQTGVTLLCLEFDRTYQYTVIRREELTPLGLVSSGIWIGFIFLLTGVIGVIATWKKRKPKIGSAPARESYTLLTHGFLALSLISAILSVVLIGISAALSADWIQFSIYPNPYLSLSSVNFPPVNYIPNSQTPTTIASLGFVMVFLGLISLPVNIIATYTTCLIIRNSKVVGKVIFYSGPPSFVNRPHPQPLNNVRRVEVVTRPANQIHSMTPTISAHSGGHMSVARRYSNSSLRSSQLSVSCDF